MSQRACDRDPAPQPPGPKHQGQIHHSPPRAGQTKPALRRLPWQTWRRTRRPRPSLRQCRASVASIHPIHPSSRTPTLPPTPAQPRTLKTLKGNARACDVRAGGPCVRLDFKPAAATFPLHPALPSSQQASPIPKGLLGEATVTQRFVCPRRVASVTRPTSAPPLGIAPSPRQWGPVHNLDRVSAPARPSLPD
jgi:hypothetical protein